MFPPKYAAARYLATHSWSTATGSAARYRYRPDESVEWQLAHLKWFSLGYPMTHYTKQRNQLKLTLLIFLRLTQSQVPFLRRLPAKRALRQGTRRVRYFRRSRNSSTEVPATINSCTKIFTRLPQVLLSTINVKPESMKGGLSGWRIPPTYSVS